MPRDADPCCNGSSPTVPDLHWGLGGSLIIVIPSLDLVIARTGKVAPAAPKWRPDWNGDYAIIEPFLTPIVESVEE
jgi:hypothetical protein